MRSALHNSAASVSLKEPVQSFSLRLPRCSLFLNVKKRKPTKGRHHLLFEYPLHSNIFKPNLKPLCVSYPVMTLSLQARLPLRSTERHYFIQQTAVSLASKLFPQKLPGWPLWQRASKQGQSECQPPGGSIMNGACRVSKMLKGPRQTLNTEPTRVQSGFHPVTDSSVSQTDARLPASPWQDKVWRSMRFSAVWHQGLMTFYLSLWAKRLRTIEKKTFIWSVYWLSLMLGSKFQNKIRKNKAILYIDSRGHIE